MTNLDWKVEELDYKRGETKVHFFENERAAKNAASHILKQGHGANIYKKDDSISGGWSNRGKYLPKEIWGEVYKEAKKRIPTPKRNFGRRR